MKERRPARSHHLRGAYGFTITGRIARHPGPQRRGLRRMTCGHARCCRSCADEAT